VSIFLALSIQQALCKRLHIVCPAPLYTSFPHYLIDSTFFEKTLVNIKCVFRISLQLLSETFFILRRIGQDVIKKIVLVFVWSTPYSCQILMEFAFSLQIFEKILNCKISWNLFSRTRVFPCVQTEGQAWQSCWSFFAIVRRLLMKGILLLLKFCVNFFFHGLTAHIGRWPPHWRGLTITLKTPHTL